MQRKLLRIGLFLLAGILLTGLSSEIPELSNLTDGVLLGRIRLSLNTPRI